MSLIRRFINNRRIVKYNYSGVAKIVDLTSPLSNNANIINFNGDRQTSLFESLGSFRQYGIDIKYPKIVMIGNQSSGKTSLTEGMCGINGLFDKKSGMATQRPTHITLVSNYEGDDYIKIGNLGEKIYNIDRARKRLYEENEGGISDKPLDVVIYSKGIKKECIFVDLMGFITSTKNDEDAGLPKRIRDICLPYITDSANIKMAVMSATEDPALSYAVKLIKKYDQMNNTVGVYTKIDMIVNDKVQGRNVMELLNDRSYHVSNLGVVGVKLRSQADLASNMTIEEMIKNEETFITKYNLNKKGTNVGLPRLMEIISTEQVKRISHTFPAIKTQINKILEGKRQGQGVLRKLIETDDVHGISVELERIITDLHPLSPIRVVLEQTIMLGIRNFVRAYVKENMISYPNHLYTIDRKGPILNMQLNQFRYGARNNRLDLDDFRNAEKLSDYLILGECSREISVPELSQAIKDNLAKGLISGFVQVMHTTAATTLNSSSSKNTVINWNRVQFTRDIQKIISSLTTEEFTSEVVKIVTNEIKNFVIKNANESNQKGVAELFFIHIFEIICERAGVEELKQSVYRLVRRENRPFIDYNDLVVAAYKRHLERIKSSGGKTRNAINVPGIFEEDEYPLALHMYSEQMLEAYIDVLVERLSNDLFRMLAVNLLNPIIINTIEVSLKTIKNKDFSKQEKIINDTIQLLEKQIGTIDEISKPKEK